MVVAVGNGQLGDEFAEATRDSKIIKRNRTENFVTDNEHYDHITKAKSDSAARSYNQANTASSAKVPELSRKNK